MVDNVSYVQVSAQALVIIHCPHVSTAYLSKGVCVCWGGGAERGAQAFLPCSQYLVPLCMSYLGREGHGHFVYKYTWSIRCCATCCNMPVPLPCH